VVVLGTAGSGKTTMAILRAAYLADPSTDHYGKTLLVTFNRALTSYIRHLQDRALPHVVVENYHRFARGYLGSRGKLPWGSICDAGLREQLTAESVSEVARRSDETSLLSRPVDFFLDEAMWIERHGLRTLQEYNDAERIGRATARIGRGKQRRLMWEVYKGYLARRERSGKLYDWDDIASVVSQELDRDATPRRYRHVVIDEGQDFSPEMIKSLARAVRGDGSVTFFADMAQQIYGRRMSWRSAGLNIAVPWEFKENYRNTKQIAILALAISQMPYFRGVSDLVEPVAPTADGPLPVVVRCSSENEEKDIVVDQAARLARTQSVAVLCRKVRDELRLRSRLPRSAIRLAPTVQWQVGPGIYFGTYHSAKGLEFDAVILPFCSAERLPDPDAARALGIDEAASEDGKLLYVVVTRAKTRLILTHIGELTSLMPSAGGLYQIVVT
jgi:superfamily I DNA/RNA helicase